MDEVEDGFILQLLEAPHLHYDQALTLAHSPDRQLLAQLRLEGPGIKSKVVVLQKLSLEVLYLLREVFDEVLFGEGSDYHFDLSSPVLSGSEDVGLHGGDTVAHVLQCFEDAVGSIDARHDEHVHSCLHQSLNLLHVRILLEVKHE